jgi:predicted RNase H-like HicB family nuclease
MHSESDTEEEAIENIIKTIELYLEAVSDIQSTTN